MKTKIKVGIGVTVILVALALVLGQSGLSLGTLGPFQIKIKAVSVSLTSPPASRTAFGNETVSVLGLTIKNNSKNDITVKKVAVRLFADRDGNFGPRGFGDTSANSLVKSVRLSEKINRPPFTTPIAKTSTLFPVKTGTQTYYKAKFSNLTHPIAKLSSKTWIITVQLRNPNEMRYLAAGVSPGFPENDIVATDPLGKSVQISTKRINAASKPKVMITILPLGTVPSLPKEPPWDETRLVSVEDKAFGAYGKPTPGTTEAENYVDLNDDSEAFQKAADTSSQIYVPSGIYFLSRAINFHGPATLISDGKAIIHQKCETCPIFVFEGGFPIRIRGLKFAHGTSQIVINNAEKDGTYVSIKDAEFQGATEFSIYADGELSNNPQSTLLITKSKFEGVAGVLRSIFGKAFVIDSNVTPCFQKDDTAAVVNRAGTLVFDNFFSVPGCIVLEDHDNRANSITHKNLRWVDNYGEFYAFHSRFGGEWGGIATVHEFGGSVVRIEDSAISAGASRDDSGVIIVQKNFPKLIRLVGNFNILNPYFGRDPKKLPSTVTSLVEIGMNRIFDLESELIPKLKPKPPRNLKGIGVLATAKPKLTPPKNDSGFINVADFEADGGDDKDDTKEIQNAADQWKKRDSGHRGDDSVTKYPTAKDPIGKGGTLLVSSPILYFPPGVYIISDEINLSSSVNVIGDGATIRQTNPSKRIFVIRDVYGMPVIRGIRFEGGTRQIDVSNRNVGGTIITIEDSEFVGATEYAIYTLGTSAADIHMSAPLIIDRSTFINPKKVLHNVSDMAVFRNSSIILGNLFQDDSAVIDNPMGGIYFNNVTGESSQGYQHARYIDSFGQIFIANSTLPSLGPRSSIVHNFAEHERTWPYYGLTLGMKDSILGGDPEEKVGLIVLRKGVPKLIRFTGNDYSGNGPYISVEGLDLNKFLGKPGPLEAPESLKEFRILIEHESRDLLQSKSLPEKLRQFVVGE